MKNGNFQGREVVIVEAARTPIGRGHEEKGYYKDVHASNLLAKTYSDVIERAGIDPAVVEDAIAGCAQQFGEQGINIPRNAWLEAGLPIETPATTVDRQCGSAQQAVNFGAALVASGVADTVIGDGTKIDNLVQLGHNVKVGRTCLICGCVAVGGSTVIGDRVVLGGKAAVADHLTIGANSVITGNSGVASNVPPGRIMMGYPAVRMDQNVEIYKALRRLPRLMARLDAAQKPVSNPGTSD